MINALADEDQDVKGLLYHLSTLSHHFQRTMYLDSSLHLLHNISQRLTIHSEGSPLV